MGASLDSRDDWHPYVGYVFQNLNAFVVNLAPNPGIGYIAERGPLDISNELPTCAREDHDLVGSILRNPVAGLGKLRVSLCSHNERPAVVVKLSNQHTLVISCQLQVVISIEVISLKCRHKFSLSSSCQHQSSVAVESFRECPQDLYSFGRLRADRIIRVHIGGTDDALLVNHVPRGQRQAVFRFIVEPVQVAPEGLVKLPQVVRQRKHEPELLCGLEVKIRQDVKRQVQLLVKAAGVTFEFRSEYHNA